MWKPTKEGIYRHGGKEAHVMYPGTISVSDGPAPRYCPDNWSFPVATCPDDWRRWEGRLTPVPDGTWSLLAPDWQPGAPTAAQLGRWQWWALALKGDEYAQIICGKVSMSGDPQHLYIPSINIAAVVKSAPIQPDLSNGPLWVPLEVAK